MIKNFQKAVILRNRGFRKTYVKTLKLVKNYINYSAFDSRHFALSNTMEIKKSKNLTKIDVLEWEGSLKWRNNDCSQHDQA